MDSVKGLTRRTLAATVVAASVLAAALVIVEKPGRGRTGPDQADLPWALPPLTASAVRGGSSTAAEMSAAPAALIYVTHTCPHCKAELARWDSLAPGSHPGLVADVRARVRVIASPSSPMEPLDWVPASLRARTVHDADGDIARELGVRAVPATFWVDAADTVRWVRTGQTGRSALVAFINSHFRRSQ